MPTDDGPSPAPARAPSWTRWTPAILILLAIGGASGLGLHGGLAWEELRGRLDGLQEQARRDVPAALAVFFLLYTAVTALSLPAAAGLSLVAGAVFGRWLGTLVVLLAATLGATLALLGSRYLLRDWVRRRFGARLETIDRGVERDGAYYLLALRLVPAVPFVLVNLGMGLTRMNVMPFALVSLVGMLPGTFLYVNAGAALGSVTTPGEVLTPRVLLALALLGIGPLALRTLLRRVGRRVHDDLPAGADPL
ncbi:MAG TPA: TVP38/TMEM64 family protein [Isosphaeraceae bacterium]